MFKKMVITSVITGLSIASTVNMSAANDESAQTGAAKKETALSILKIEMNVSKLKGSINLALFRGEDNYRSDKPIATKMIDADSLVVFTFDKLEPGEYGIKSFHDLNANGKLDTNAFGIPSEPYAFSNNAPANFGPAKWKEAVFDVSSPETVHVLEIE